MSTVAATTVLLRCRYCPWRREMPWETSDDHLRAYATVAEHVSSHPGSPPNP